MVVVSPGLLLSQKTQHRSELRLVWNEGSHKVTRLVNLIRYACKLHDKPFSFDPCKMCHRRNASAVPQEDLAALGCSLEQGLPQCEVRSSWDVPAEPLRRVFTPSVLEPGGT